jgi:hypothetical protein
MKEMSGNGVMYERDDEQCKRVLLNDGEAGIELIVHKQSRAVELIMSTHPTNAVHLKMDVYGEVTLGYSVGVEFQQVKLSDILATLKASNEQLVKKQSVTDGGDSALPPVTTDQQQAEPIREEAESIDAASDAPASESEPEELSSAPATESEPQTEISEVADESAN